MAVSSTTLYSTSWQTIKDLIEDNIVDPKTNSSSSNRHWLYTTFPKIATHGFNGFPFIVIHPSDISDDIIVMGDSIREHDITFEIEIVDEFTNTMSHIETISDSIINFLRKSTSITTLQNAGLFYPKVSSSNVTIEVIADKRIVVRAFKISFSSAVILQ